MNQVNLSEVFEQVRGFVAAGNKVELIFKKSMSDAVAAMFSAMGILGSDAPFVAVDTCADGCLVVRQEISGRIDGIAHINKANARAFLVDADLLPTAEPETEKPANLDSLAALFIANARRVTPIPSGSKVELITKNAGGYRHPAAGQYGVVVGQCLVDSSAHVGAVSRIEDHEVAVLDSDGDLVVFRLDQRYLRVID